MNNDTLDFTDVSDQVVKPEYRNNLVDFDRVPDIVKSIRGPSRIRLLVSISWTVLLASAVIAISRMYIGGGFGFWDALSVFC